MLKSTFAACLVALTAFAGTASAGSWTLDADASRIAFGSIKKDKIGEVHSFAGLSGAVAEGGRATISIDLASVETNIDIRNERMNEHVFKGVTTATLSAPIDMAELEALQPGRSTLIDVEGALAFLGAEVEVELEMFVMRISETQVMVTSNEMIFPTTEDLGIDAGVDKLMELAKLPGVTRATPVTLRLVFNADVKKAEAAPAAPASAPVVLAAATFEGDAKAGKKAFRKCKARHSVKADRNGVGPSLHGVIGRAAGAVEGFDYSDAMAASGLVWDGATLSAFLADPKAVVKGASMAFRGVKKAEDIDNLLAYLAER